MHNQQDPQDSFLCPSFNSYSTDKLADVADRVAREQFRRHDHAVAADSADFEFVTFRKAADEVFFDGRVGPVFPVFDRDLLKDDVIGRRSSDAEEDALALQFSMRKLLIDDEDPALADRDPPSSSSSDVDDLESIPPGTYCVWTPKTAKASPSRCEKSNSTGTSSSSSKKWKLLDLLRRSNSDGKESFVFLTPSASMKKKEARAENSKEQWSSGSSLSISKVAGKQKAKGQGNSGDIVKKMSAHEAFYLRNRELKKVDRRKSYLPYRQDLVGFFANVHGLGKPFTPF
ncbi:uncharacterized protein LOC129288076 [Prosopis cineraria]|uniref:uncharacterized protein LOC129288076 n=1 Tax=Prosopis cineraria TaxID=364024 RepID=UPI00240F7F55|nr:uncharacterized protein LOC129288076 [Prosopis cineraria]